MADNDLIELAMRMVRAKEPNAREAADGGPEPPPQIPDEVQAPPPLPAATVSAGLSHNAPVKGAKTADELAAMILFAPARRTKSSLRPAIPPVVTPSRRRGGPRRSARGTSLTRATIAGKPA